MDKRLNKTRADIYSKCPGIYWAVSIFAIVIAIALAAFEALMPGLYLLTFTFLFFPLLFSVYMTLYTIKFGGTITAKSTFQIAKSYFTRGNFGCFRVLKCFFHAALVFFIALIIFTTALQPVFVKVYGNSFTSQLQVLLDAITSGDSAIEELLSKDSPVTLYYVFCYSFSFSSSLIAFVFGICFNSSNVYLCANIPNGTASYCTVIFNKFMRRNGRSYRKDFWSLNWPVFVLLLLGIVTGYALTILLDIDFSYGTVISTMIGLAFLIPFAPFFFAGMEALFAKYNESMRKASMDLTQGFLEELKQNMNLSEEDRKKIEELLSKQKEPTEQNSSDEDNDQSQG